jgi:hypothetical protein
MENKELVDFDTWYVMRESAIPRQHHKEILKADFKARGLKEQEPVEVFDKALIRYGVKLA